MAELTLKDVNDKTDRAQRTADIATAKATSAEDLAQKALNAAQIADRKAEGAQTTANSAERRSLFNEEQIREIKRQMADIDKAIDRMSQELAGRLEDLSSQTKQLSDRNAAGLAAVTGMTAKVDNSVQAVEGSVAKNTNALAQMEYLRLYNEAKAPAKRIQKFEAEIQQRFNQSVTNIYLNRSLYDKHFEAIETEALTKTRAIGEHIFKVLEEDFAPILKKLSCLPDQYTDNAIELDMIRIEERAKQLDMDLVDLYEESLQPILQRHAEFETSLSSKFSVEGKSVPSGDFAIPATLAFNANGTASVVVGTTVSRDSDDNLDLLMNENYREINDVLNENRSLIYSKSNYRDFTAAEVSALKGHLESLAQQGIIQTELLPGYFEYLDRFGLAVVKGGDGPVSLSFGPQTSPTDSNATDRLLHAMTLIAESNGAQVQIPGIPGTWRPEDLICTEASLTIPEEPDLSGLAISLPFPGSRLRRALGVTIEHAETVLRPVYRWEADAVDDDDETISSLATANINIIRFNSELRRLGLYDQAYDDMLGGGLSSEKYAEIASNLGMDEAALAQVPFAADALRESDLSVERRVAAALKSLGTYELMYALDQQHPQFGNDYLSPEQWAAAFSKAGVSAKEFFETWYLEWLDDAGENNVEDEEGSDDRAETAVDDLGPANESTPVLTGSTEVDRQSNAAALDDDPNSIQAENEPEAPFEVNVMVSRGNRSKTVAVRADSFWIGSDTDCECRVELEGIEPKHLRVDYESGFFYAAAGSPLVNANVNDKPVTETGRQFIPEGSKVDLGNGIVITLSTKKGGLDHA